MTEGMVARDVLDLIASVERLGTEDLVDRAVRAAVERTGLRPATESRFAGKGRRAGR